MSVAVAPISAQSLSWSSMSRYGGVLGRVRRARRAATRAASASDSPLVEAPRPWPSCRSRCPRAERRWNVFRSGSGSRRRTGSARVPGETAVCSPKVSACSTARSSGESLPSGGLAARSGCDVSRKSSVYVRAPPARRVGSSQTTSVASPARCQRVVDARRARVERVRVALVLGALPVGEEAEAPSPGAGPEALLGVLEVEELALGRVEEHRVGGLAQVERGDEGRRVLRGREVGAHEQQRPVARRDHEAHARVRPGARRDLPEGHRRGEGEVAGPRSSTPSRGGPRPRPRP